ncbi:MAG TPA: PIG-L family deacetylase [Candidatus Limnocylindrales bacterium]|jgi:LmbE family N-acetylglucosaminyl deacetylase|nr:PIG-L family deacetylase [Candidatus Limnocylindrales bacterium]
MPERGVLFVHAHPDDESIATGGTIARLVAEGVRVDLVTCTDGAEGEIHDSTLDPDEARPRLAEIRRAELACSLEALGDGAIHHHLLGYRDSGMMGTEANDHPESFWKADLDAATGRLVEIVREARPAVIVSYDENGNYGHPDHINAARIAREAYQASRGEPWAVSRFHEIAFHRESWFELMRDMRARGIALPWDFDRVVDPPPPDELNPTNAAALGQVAEGLETGEAWEMDFGRPDAEVTTRVDVAACVDAKRRSMDCHRTQRQDMGWLLDLPADLADRALRTEYFVLRWLDGADVPVTHREASLFG